MFRRLKQQFILTTMAGTTIVLVLAFSIIYFIAQNSASQRPPVQMNIEYSENITRIFEDRLEEERQASLGSLLTSLLITGFSIEIIVFLLSIYLADQAIQPVKIAYEAQKSFIANASHEIKTPLAVISANLEAADIQDNHWIDNVSIKVEELTALNNQLLALARAEGSLAEQKDIVELDLKKTTKDTINPFKPQITQRGIKLTYTINTTDKKKIRLNRPALKQILGILIDNAIKYSDSSINVTINDDSIAITNDGAIISKKQLAHLFDRFYQIDKNKSGVGLGLAIAQELATQNSWSLTAESNRHSTTFTLVL